jgi:YDG domain/Subtilase family
MRMLCLMLRTILVQTTPDPREPRPVRNRVALLVAVLAMSQAALAQNTGPAQGKAFASAQVMEQIAAMGREKDTWTAVQRKISSKLLLETKRRLGEPMAAGVAETRSSVDIDATGATLVDIRAEVSDALLRRIQGLGGQVINSHARFNAIRALVPVAQLEVLAGEAAVKSIKPADQAVLHKTNTSQGVVAHRADIARTTYGVDGTGVSVGVLSDSVDSLAAVQATGDLPAQVTVLPGQGSSGTGEGTAMLEIVYDIAPGANLFFATANGGQAQFAQNILALGAAGCNVIVDDVGYLAEPVFQDGIVAQAVETVTAAGAVYFSAAGNSGNLTDGTSGVWEGDFVATAGSGPLAGSTVHDFGGGVSYDTVTVDSPSLFTLQWSDAFGASANDYDLYLLNSARTVIYDASTDAQSGTQDPFEAIDSSGFNDVGNVLVIVQYSGSARYLHLNSNRGRLAIETSGQTWGHSAAASAFSVAAVNVGTAGGGAFVGGSSNPVETFSSDGLRRVFYTADGTPITPGNFSSTGGSVRQKPDIAAADGVSCATPGFNPFFGTSAAAPHAAGIAALIIANGLNTPAQVREAITNTTWDIEAAGVDRDSGYGIVNALAAVGYEVVHTVTVSGITAADKAYDGTAAATIDTSGATLSGVLPADTGNVTLVTGGATGAFADENVGLGKTVTISGLSLSGSAAGNYTVTTPTTTTANITGVAGRYVFYNNSAWDGNSPAADPNDDQAVAPDKVPLLAGAATFANYTSYSRGINGIMVDIVGLSGTPTADDFIFRVGNDDNPTLWPTAPASSGITVRSGSGVGGSDRITIIWPDNAIQKKWLQVTAKATANTGLTSDDVFYFGNAIGESGNSSADAKVDPADELLARSHPRNVLNPAPIDFPYDYNRDKRVDPGDQLIARANQTSVITALRLIDLSAFSPGSAALQSLAGVSSPKVATLNGTGNEGPRSAGGEAAAGPAGNTGSGDAPRLSVRMDGSNVICVESPRRTGTGLRLQACDDLVSGQWYDSGVEPEFDPVADVCRWRIKVSETQPQQFYRICRSP